MRDSSSDVIANYTYDALGRRIQNEAYEDGITIRCYYDGQRVLLETDDSNNDERYFVFGNYIDGKPGTVTIFSGRTSYGRCPPVRRLAAPRPQENKHFAKSPE